MPYNDSYNPHSNFSLFPPVIKTVIVTNIAFFILASFSKFIAVERATLLGYETVSLYEYVLRHFALMPLGYGFYLWQLITYQFLHASFGHLFFNMFAFWMFGMEIENYLGSKRFLLYYLLCGIGAGIIHIIFSPILSGQFAPTIGASGAVYGILIAFALLFPNRYIFLYFLFPIKAKYLIGFYIILELLSIGDFSAVAHLAHIGGAIMGYVLLKLFKYWDIYSINRSYHNYNKRKNNPNDFFSRVKPYTRKKEEIYVDYEEVSYIDSDEPTQEEIDRILDKISIGGYQSLSEKEKEILFKASKKKWNIKK